MPKVPPYRLQALLELRERKKEEAERFLGECITSLKKEQDRLKEMELILERMVAMRDAKKREYMETAMRGEMSAQSAINANKYIDRLKEQEEAQKTAIEAQKGVIKQKEEDVEGARKALVEAMQSLKALEKHKEKIETDWKKEMAAKEEETMDELAQTIYMGQTHGQSDE